MLSNRYQKQRNNLVEVLREKGIKDDQVLAAIRSIPRHTFVDSALWTRAYEDIALPIGLDQTISQPYTVARQTELLQLRQGMKVLEIGTGSGYQCAVLCEMGAKVYSIERHQPLHERSREHLRELGYRPMLKCDDGTVGWSAYAPYDGIVVTAGAPVVPESLKEQLNIGGRLVIPVGDSSTQHMHVITRVSKELFKEDVLDGFKFVPLIGREGWR
ncbi:MAG: protein-L-isoaspartate(D-aspartate) O-methyltransferase [Bacteroidetes bacterium]|nr:protein-L-isoaspartate(D-aspartate) O-methyltransferase [Bacteroidota bacterium]MCH8524837.1 protein-L-isoaspartate(D-aspartate) O-methyltransferase [Balneolales bacterium]